MVFQPSEWQLYAARSYPDTGIGASRPKSLQTRPKGNKTDNWNKRWFDVWVEFQTYPEEVRRILQGVPLYTQNRIGVIAKNAFYKTDRAVQLAKEMSPVTPTSKSYSQGYQEWVLFCRICQSGVRHYAAETYCSACAVKEAQFEADWREERQKAGCPVIIPTVTVEPEWLVRRHQEEEKERARGVVPEPWGEEPSAQW